MFLCPSFIYHFLLSLLCSKLSYLVWLTSTSYTVLLFDMFLQPYGFSTILEMDHNAHNGGECKGSTLACQVASEWRSCKNLQNPSVASGFTGRMIVNEDIIKNPSNKFYWKPLNGCCILKVYSEVTCRLAVIFVVSDIIFLHSVT